MIVKVSFLVAASVATFAVSQINSNSSRNRTKNVCPPDGAFMSSEKDEKEEEELANSDIPGLISLFFLHILDEKAVKMINGKIMNNVKETKLSRKLAMELEQRKVTLEGKMFELYCLKEKQSSVYQLQKHLEENSEEIDMLNATVFSLQADRENLKEEIKRSVLAKKQLEKAKRFVLELQKNIDVRESHVKGQVCKIEEHVCGLKNDEVSIRTAMIEQKLKAVESVKLDVVEMKRRNKELELEKRELAFKLISAQARMAALSCLTENNILAKIQEETIMLRKGNEDLLQQIDGLQKERFNMVEELVYQRWLHSCFRFEIQNSPRETSKLNLCRNPFLNSVEKVQPRVLYPSSNSISSFTSSTESDQVESHTAESSSSSQNSCKKSSSFMHKMKSWGRSKHNSSVASSKESKGNPSTRSGLIRRFSTSMVPVNSSMRRNKGDCASNSSFKKKKDNDQTESSKKPSCPRVRRVSFNDLVQTDEGVLNNREISADRSGQSSIMKTSYNISTDFEVKEQSKFSAELRTLFKAEDSRNTSPENSHVGSGNEVASTKEPRFDMLPEEEEYKVEIETSMVHLYIAIFFFLFIFLAYFLHITARFRKYL